MTTETTRPGRSGHEGLAQPSDSGRGQSCGVGATNAGGGAARRKKRDIMDGLLPEILQVIERPQSTGGESNVAISGVEPMASYSWTGREIPTIIVPGSPRIWSNPTFPLTVSGESGESFIDQNAYRLPDHPMLPIFEAIDALTAGGLRTPPSWTSIDIITDRNNLLKLAGWADSGCSSTRSKKDFRIDFELVGQRTLLLQRWEDRTRSWAEHAFGDAFEKAASRPAPGCEDSTLAGSSRVISYDYSGLRLVVRFDVDAYKSPEEESASPSPGTQSVDGLVDALPSLTVPSSTPTLLSPPPLKYAGGPAVILGGHEVPQNSLIKIKTRVQGSTGGFPGSAEYLQLLLGQTPAMYVGIHKDGMFTSIKERRLDSPEWARAAEKIQPGLSKLRRLLEEIQKVAVERGKGAHLSLVCRKGVLEVMERSDGKPLLPEEILHRFLD